MRLSLILILLLAPFAARAENFDLRDGDRVALIGDTLIEREQESGWLETVMGASFPDRHHRAQPGLERGHAGGREPRFLRFQ
jgi:hypothetical protein